MLKMYSVFCALIVILLSVANVRGYVITSLFTGVAHAGRAANHYHK